MITYDIVMYFIDIESTEWANIDLWNVSNENILE